MIVSCIMMEMCGGKLSGLQNVKEYTDGMWIERV